MALSFHRSAGKPFLGLSNHHPNDYAPLNAWDSANAQNFDIHQAARDPRQPQFALKLNH